MAAASIRVRITALAALAVIVVLAAAGTALVVTQRSQLIDNLDAGLRQRADDLSIQIAQAIPEVLGASNQPGFAQLIAPEGVVLAASLDLAGDPPVLPRSSAGPGDTIVTLENLPFDDDPYRVLARPVGSAAGQAILVVGLSLDPVGDSTETLTSSLLVSIPLVAGLLAWLVWLLLGRTLRHVEAITTRVGSIGGRDLEQRVPVPAAEDEIARLARTMNQMLHRLEESAGRQQRFVADASHELRSPLTRMRAELEVEIRGAESGHRSTLSSLLDEVIGLQALVEDLLHLAESDAGLGTPNHELVDLDDIVLEEARHLTAAAQVQIDLGGVSAARARGDARQLRRAVTNLFDNAARHAATKIVVSLQEVDGWVEMIVADDGPGVPANQRELIFERFGRADDSRSRSSGGTGLGLAIASDIAARHGGTLTLEPSTLGGATFRMRMPAS